MIAAFWIRCAAPDCENRLSVDVRHVRNFEGRDWRCADHEDS